MRRTGCGMWEQTAVNSLLTVSDYLELPRLHAPTKEAGVQSCSLPDATGRACRRQRARLAKAIPVLIYPLWTPLHRPCTILPMGLVSRRVRRRASGCRRQTSEESRDAGKAATRRLSATSSLTPNGVTHTLLCDLHVLLPLGFRVVHLVNCPAHETARHE